MPKKMTGHRKPRVFIVSEARVEAMNQFGDEDLSDVSGEDFDELVDMIQEGMDANEEEANRTQKAKGVRG